jgi:hypothetical protein
MKNTINPILVGMTFIVCPGANAEQPANGDAEMTAAQNPKQSVTAVAHARIVKGVRIEGRHTPRAGTRFNFRRRNVSCPEQEASDLPACVEAILDLE